MLFVTMMGAALAQQCFPPGGFPGAETVAFGVEIEVEDGGLNGLNVRMALDGETWLLPGRLSPFARDWTLIENWGTLACPEDSECDLGVKFILGLTGSLSVDKSGDPYTVILAECE